MWKLFIFISLDKMVTEKKCVQYACFSIKRLNRLMLLQ